ncbi:MAG: hypothetical protein QM809_14635 [Gordonia sp. (in: high G+C Gram-positive bacteria)]|uniref:hypothetical protein n=1 Tax=Gordonia sp. (in: high G+C Gram-positive bacteria) TaxID=84139 RepID=UPI0039E70920
MRCDDAVADLGADRPEFVVVATGGGEPLFEFVGVEVGEEASCGGQVGVGVEPDRVGVGVVEPESEPFLVVAAQDGDLITVWSGVESVHAGEAFE